MMELVYIVAPIFLVILSGYILKNKLIKSDDTWTDINTLTYWGLFPALLFNKTSGISLEGYSVGTFSAALIGGYLMAVFFSYVFGRVVKLKPSSLTSVLQGGGRHNSFVALAILSQLLGPEGELVGALAIAVMVTFSNVFTIIMMTSILSNGSKRIKVIISEIIRNPFIVAIALGLTMNYLGFSHIPMISGFTAELGKAALPVALLCVGAGLQFVDVRSFVLPTAIACVAKMLVLPVTVYMIAVYYNLSPVLTTAAVIFASVPTSSTAYALAKYMGGDAPLMAAIISLQTMLAVIVIPAAIILVG